MRREPATISLTVFINIVFHNKRNTNMQPTLPSCSGTKFSCPIAQSKKATYKVPVYSILLPLPKPAFAVLDVMALTSTFLDSPSVICQTDEKHTTDDTIHEVARKDIFKKKHQLFTFFCVFSPKEISNFNERPKFTSRTNF